MTTWEQPKLVVLSRGTAAESLATGCKNSTKTGESASSNVKCCEEDDGPCSQCDSRNVAS